VETGPGFQSWPILAAGSAYALVWATGLGVAHLSKLLTARMHRGTGALPLHAPVTTDWRRALKAWMQLTCAALPAGMAGAWVAVNFSTPLAWTEFVDLPLPVLVIRFFIAIRTPHRLCRA